MSEIQINTPTDDTAVVTAQFYTVREDLLKVNGQTKTNSFSDMIDVNDDGKVSHDELVAYIIKTSGNRKQESETDRKWAEEQVQKMIKKRLVTVE